MSLIAKTTNSATKKFICEGNSDIMPNDCPDGDFIENDFVSREDLETNRLERSLWTFSITKRQHLWK